MADIDGLKLSPKTYFKEYQLFENAILLGDKAFTNDLLEDDLLKMMGISLCPKRRKNLNRQYS